MMDFLVKGYSHALRQRSYLLNEVGRRFAAMPWKLERRSFMFHVLCFMFVSIGTTLTVGESAGVRGM